MLERESDVRGKRRYAEETDRRLPVENLKVWAAVTGGVLVVAVTVVAVASRPPRPQEEQPGAPRLAAVPDWSAVGAVATSGPARIEALWARNSEIEGREGRKQVRLDSRLCIKLKLTNITTTRNIRFAGWQSDGKTRIEDEHGNLYRAKPLPIGFAAAPQPFAWAGWMNTPTPGCEAPGDWFHFVLHPEKSYEAFLLAEPLPDAAKEVRLTLPGGGLEGAGDVRLKIQVSP